MSAFSTESLPMLAAHMSRSMLSVPPYGLLTSMRLQSGPSFALLIIMCSSSAGGMSSLMSTSCKISSTVP